MPYATEQDLIARYGKAAVIIASDRDGDGQSDAGVIDTALADASALIDTYVGARYALPLDSVPLSLKRCCVDIAMYQMSADAATATEEQRHRHSDAMKHLKAIANGTASLGLDTPPPEDPRSGSASFAAKAARRFSRESLRGF